MLTRLKVKGFKNLLDVDVRFGPFTCIAGVNGVGKSNLFDAIRFLSLLADKPLLEAALSIRNDEGTNHSDIRTLFHRVGDRYGKVMSFEAELVIPQTGIDAFNREAKASITFVRYKVAIGLRDSSPTGPGENLLELKEEELTHINIGDVRKHLLFDFNNDWKKSVITGRRSAPFISTDPTSDGSREIKKIQLHQDGKAGLARSLPASNLQRTVLSGMNASENPTALIVRQEMLSWKMLQLEPTALRKPDSYTAPTVLAQDGAHLPATLFRLAKKGEGSTPPTGNRSDSENNQVYATLARRLSELIREARGIWIDKDETRELLTLNLIARDQTSHPAHALSDGTLRFLALSVLDLDPLSKGLLCLEEPENGIHPDRIPSILKLLQDIACDTGYAVDDENPLRQVIINTHSPAVVRKVPEDCLLMAKLSETKIDKSATNHVRFHPLSETWRAEADGPPPVTKGDLLAYLSPDGEQPSRNFSDEFQKFKRQQRANGIKVQVGDRKDLQPYLFNKSEEQA